ncbi:hypothetical protein F4806DRAFT_468473 [Annulohypoxylon nitens]|nr:hypothetical protein F4806DRAFT_468473 [Annulohypoxylon nitens]
MTLLPPLEDAGLLVALAVVPPQTAAVIVVTPYLNSRDVSWHRFPGYQPDSLLSSHYSGIQQKPLRSQVYHKSPVMIIRFALL